MAFLTDANNRGHLEGITATWDMELGKVHGGLDISGSPERSLSRIVVEDREHRLYLLEEISSRALPEKKRIALNLEKIKGKGVARVYPYLCNRRGEYHSEYRGLYFQISPYLTGTPLKRPEYVYDGFRGKVLADFLVEFYEKTRDADMVQDPGDSFSIVSYVEDIKGNIQTHNPEIMDRVRPVNDFLDRGFKENHDGIPRSFCHGDYHVLNVIWGESDLVGVIDWEFSGYRPEIYDMANMLGCIGIEDPRALKGPLVGNFLKTMTEWGGISETGLQYLTEFVVALRFAWLSEWLRHKDRAMIDLELVYMNLLVENSDHLFRNLTP